MTPDERSRSKDLPADVRVFRFGPLQSDGASGTPQEVRIGGRDFLPAKNAHWKTNLDGMYRLARAGKIVNAGNSIHYRLYWGSFAGKTLDNIWLDTQSGGFNDPKVYVVQTTTKVVQRCILMATDPGDLVLDPTCGSGTTAYVAEQWGRRWITIDTSRVALALARARIMGARYPYYLLADSADGKQKETGDHASRTLGCPLTRRDSSGLRLRACPTHHAPRHRQQRRDRRDLGAVPGAARTAARAAQRCPRRVVGGVGDPSGGRGRVAGRGSGAARAVVGAAYRAPARDRRLHRREGGLRVPLRQALHRQPQGAASPGRSRSRASRLTASSASTRTTS